MSPKQERRMNILNLTQHAATEEQVAAGVYDPTPEQRAQICALLTFENLPDEGELRRRAAKIAVIAIKEKVFVAMIGGAPWFMAPLERALETAGVMPWYAFSRRESVETTLPDGSVKKTQVFRHAGFVRACPE